MTCPRYCWFHGHPDTVVYIMYIYMNHMEMMWNTMYNLKQNMWNNNDIIQDNCLNIYILWYTTEHNISKTNTSNTHTRTFLSALPRWVLLSAFAVLLRWRGSRNTGGLGESRFFRSWPFLVVSSHLFPEVRWPPFGWSKGHFESPGCFFSNRWFKVTWLHPPVEGHVFNHIKGSLTRVKTFLRDPAFFWCISIEFFHGISEKSRVEMIMLIGLSWELKTGLEGMF